MTVNMVFCGSSITAGNHLGVNQNFPELIHIARPSYGFHNIAAGSAYIDNTSQGAAADALVDGSDFNVLIAEWGINDMAPGGGQDESAATFFSNYKTWFQARTGFNRKVSWACLPANDATFLTRRGTFNTSLAADTSFYTVRANVGGDPTIGPDAACTNLTYYQDGTHPTALCAGSYIEPIVLAAIDAATGLTGHFATCFAGVAR